MWPGGGVLMANQSWPGSKKNSMKLVVISILVLAAIAVFVYQVDFSSPADAVTKLEQMASDASAHVNAAIKDPSAAFDKAKQAVSEGIKKADQTFHVQEGLVDLGVLQPPAPFTTRYRKVIIGVTVAVAVLLALVAAAASYYFLHYLPSTQAEQLEVHVPEPMKQPTV